MSFEWGYEDGTVVLIDKFAVQPIPSLTLPHIASSPSSSASPANSNDYDVPTDSSYSDSDFGYNVQRMSLRRSNPSKTQHSKYTADEFFETPYDPRSDPVSKPIPDLGAFLASFHSSNSSPASTSLVDDEADSDKDAEGETDDDASEYTPSSPIATNKRLASSAPFTSKRARLISRPPPPTMHSHFPTPTLAGPRRNTPYPTPSSSSSSSSPPSTSTSSQKSNSRSRKVHTLSTSSPDLSAWRCPECSWVQKNRRTPDLNRHISTHNTSTPWVCNGLPHPVQDEDGVMKRYGGCGKAFSRRDALKRHLDNDNVPCVGDLSMSPVESATALPVMCAF